MNVDWQSHLHLMRQGQQREHEKKLRRLLKKTAGAPEAEAAVWALLGLTLLKNQGRSEEGLQALQTAKEGWQYLDSDAMADLGGGFLLAGQYDEAKACLLRVLTQAPDHPVAQARLAMVFMALEDYGSARPLLEKAVAARPESMALKHNLALVLVKEGEYQQGLALLDEGEGKSLSPLAQKTRLEALVGVGDIEEAFQWSLSMDLQGDRLAKILRHASVFAIDLKRPDDAEYFLRRGLEKEPLNPELLFGFSELATQRGRFQEAIHAVNTALEQEPDTLRFLILRSELLLHTRQLDLARREAEKALAECERQEMADLRPNALCTLAMVVVEKREFDRAESLFIEALEVAPDLIKGLNGLGHLYLVMGKTQEAISLFDRMKNSSLPASFSSLVDAKVYPDDITVLDAVEEVARRPSLTGAVQPTLLFSLAHAWEKKKNYRKAFALALEANAAHQPDIPYDPEANTLFCRRLINRFDKNFFEARSAYGHPSLLPVFVVGMPRSGTTLVEQILASHPEVHGAGELGTLPSFVHKLDMWENHMGSGRRYPEIIDELTPGSVLRFAEGYIKALQTFSPTACRVVDKLPHNFQHIGLIHLLFPQAAIIHCVREPRDVALSNFFIDFRAKFGGLGYAYSLENLGRHIADYLLLMEHWQQTLPGRILPVRYEDMVEDTEQQCRRLLDHVGLSWYPGVLEFQRHERPVKTASLMQVRQPIYKTSKEKWRHYQKELSPFDEALQRGRSRLREMADLPQVRIGDGQTLRGVERMEAGDLSEARHHFQTVLQGAPDHAGARYLLAAIDYQQHRFHDALDGFLAVKDHYGGLDSFHENLGAVYLALGRLPEARQANLRCLEISPDKQGALEALEIIDRQLFFEKKIPPKGLGDTPERHRDFPQIPTHTS